MKNSLKLKKYLESKLNILDELEELFETEKEYNTVEDGFNEILEKEEKLILNLKKLDSENVSLIESLNRLYELPIPNGNLLLIIDKLNEPEMYKLAENIKEKFEKLFLTRKEKISSIEVKLDNLRFEQKSLDTTKRILNSYYHVDRKARFIDTTE